ncbi:integrin alpha-2 [Oncorhynchus tshawytscha]|uniref:Integrin subunit alpha 2 n=1 Tax=Oncorhynchus tshawytscha TaxID=74940 RepID=A0A8C8C976_ONCTS|nr:integrin alpha-2 [Oncorhynchus tshawytscha]
MEFNPKRTVLTLIFIQCWNMPGSLSFNVGTAGAKVFSEPSVEEFGYTVQQLKNHQGKWLLVGSPWSGYNQDRKGDVYKCEIRGASSGCQRLNLQNSVSISTVSNVNVNMSLGLTLTRTATEDMFMACGPLWAQKCGSQYYYPGICAEVSPLFNPLSSFSPALQTCGGPMDIAIVLDGSNSIYPWPPVVAFLKKLLENLDIGPDNTQVSIIQYAVDPDFEFYLNSYKTKDSIIAAAANIPQKLGLQTNTFRAIEFARRQAFLPTNGARPGASKVMVVVTDGESHDNGLKDDVIGKCEQEKITRFGIAVLGYYIRNDIDTKNLIAEMKSIASTPTDRYFFNVSAEEALLEIAGTLGDRIFNIEGTGKGGDFQMEMSQVGFSAHQTNKQNMMMLGAVGAYGWSGTVVHYTPQKSDIFPKTAFENILEDRNHSSLLGYSVTTLNDGSTEYYVAGAPRSNHTGQVIVYIINSKGQPTVIDSQKGDQIGSYYGSVLCPLDVDKDGVSDILLVGAPMFMNEQKKETGKVYLLSFTKGILSDQGILRGPSPADNARFGMSISAVPDLNMDGYSDVVVGAPLEDNNRGVIYVFNGDKKKLRTQCSQRILGSKLDPALKYFGRSLDANSDLNDDTIPDVSVGAYGKVVQLWSRGLAVVTARATFNPDKVNILSKTCRVSGRLVSCFNTTVCFSATFRPKIPVGPVALRYNLTLDADLQSSRVTSRGQFSNSERVLQKDIRVSTRELCDAYEVFVQEAPDFVSSIGLRVDIALHDPDSSPVLDVLRPTSWEFFIPFSKDCGSDELCESDLLLNVKKGEMIPSSSKMLVSFKNKRLSFTVSVTNKKENAYNTRVMATYSKNLFYASITPPSDETEVKCSSTRETRSLSCQVGYPALRKNQEVTFVINFDFNLNQLQTEADVSFEALSDSTEVNPSDNHASISIPVHYDSEIALSREANLNFYVVDMDNEVKTTVNTFNDIGPELKFSLKVSTGNFPVNIAYLTVSLPSDTAGGNPLLYVTGVNTAPAGDVSCEVASLVNPLKISEKPYTPSFSKENLMSTEELNCKTAKCQPMKCVLKDMGMMSDFFVNVTTRIWNGTFAASSFQSTVLTVSTEIETSQPELLVISHKHLTVGVTISKPGVKGEIPVGVIVGSVIGGLLLLALVIGLLWKFGFFRRKYQQLMKNTDEDQAETEGLQENAAA